VRDSDYQVHVCTGSGSFLPNFTGTIEVLVVAGGGGGGMDMGGGGGGGGVLTSTTYAVTSGSALTVTVGAGGVGAPAGGPPQPWGHQFTTSATSGGNSSLVVNLITDGTFNSGITGWNTYKSNISWYNNNSLRSISTSGNPAGAFYYVNTVIGQTYYYKAVVSQSGAIGNDARIQISGIGLINSTGQSTTTDTKTIYDTFTATSTTHILEILLYNSQSGAILTIDDVEIYPTNSSLVAIGGGYGGSSYFGYTPNYGYGANGGSGGGASGYSDGSTGRNGSGTAGQGNAGGSSVGQYYSGGGGGAGAAGSNGGTANGGAGLLNNILGGGRNYYWAGGGGGAGYSSGVGGNGGLGGGGGGSSNGTGDTNGINLARNAGAGGGGDWVNSPGGDGGKSTGGGGGGGMHYNRNNRGGNGGSGIVIIRHLKSLGTSTFNGSADNRSSLIFSMDPANLGKGLSVEVLVVAGGGGGGMDMGGGGGAGGVVYNPAMTTQINAAMTVIVGAGGNGSPGTYGSNPVTGLTGGNSSVGEVVGYGGGGGGSGHSSSSGYSGNANGSSGNGGGAGGDSAKSGEGKGMGTDPAPLDVPQGYSGGSAMPYAYGAGGGGGATRPGTGGRYSGGLAGAGGAGYQSSINGTSYYYGGGGGGASWTNNAGSGGLGGGGGGSCYPGYTAGSGDTNGINAGGSGVAAGSANGGNGGANTGGGGGGGTHSHSVGGNGGSGIVIVRYYGSQQATGGTITSSGGYTIHTFTSSGTFTPTGFIGVKDMGILNVPLTGYGGITYGSENGGNITFNGSDAYIDLSSTNLVAGNDPFTFECFYSISGTNVAGELFGNYGSGYTTNNLWISGRYGVYISGSVYFPGAPIGIGTYHMAASRNAAGNILLYLNGALVSSGTLSGSIPSNINFRIGSDVNGLAEQLNGKIYLMRIFNRVLTADEVLQNFQAHRSRFGI
jgi:hypothetical protein